MRLARSFRLAILFCLCLAVLVGCTRKPTSTADMPRLLSPAYSVSVLPFIQPRSNAELVMGQLPEPQGRIDGSHLAILDNRLQAVLRERKNSRRYEFVASGALPKISSGYSANQPQALPILASFAAKCGTDFLLVPQVIDWHERAQSTAQLPIVPFMTRNRPALPTIFSTWATSSAARAAGSPPQNWPKRASARP